MALAHYRLTREAGLITERGTVLESALDAVFGAMRVNEGQLGGLEVLSLAIKTTGSRHQIFANGAPIFSTGSGDALAPLLEGALVGFAVRTRRGGVPLHAAAVEINGRGVLLPGGKGSGKSTLAALLADRGARYLSDELSWIGFEDRKLDGFPKAVTLKAGAFSLFPAGKTFDDPIRGPVRYLQPRGLSGGASSGDLTMIVFPSWNPELPKMVGVELSRPQTAVLLLQACFGGLERDPNTLELLARLAEVPAFGLEYGPGDAAVDAVLDLVEL